MEVVIRIFKATEDPVTCHKFMEGHRRLLEAHFGIAKVTSTDSLWMNHENTYVIVAESVDREKIYGGARVQVADDILPLPIESAVGKYDKQIYEMIKPGTCEICGLWNSIEVSGWGIGSIFMGRVAVVAALQLNVERIFLLCAPITVRIGKRVGAIVDTSLGNNGNFYYPKDDFVATAMVFNDCNVLSQADPKERERIFDLYRNPVQQVSEMGPKGQLFVDYRLKIERPKDA